MKFPLSWLKEYIDIDLSATQIAKVLTSVGIEVDSVKPSLPNFEGVVVGKILAVVPHPNADKLSVATVTDGIESYQVVCGAPNCTVGMKTAFAKEGAILQDASGKTFTIKKTTLRSVESFGMLCSSSELQLSENNDGIIEFSDHLKEGSDVAQRYQDLIFEVSLTPNLGHCASMLGIARELSAALEKPICVPSISINEFDPELAKHMAVTVEDKIRCPRYACRLVKGVKVTSSPDWMQKKLLACGIRPINTIVDITNYVLLEFGQPLHAFDFDKLEGQMIVVRTAKEGESIVTLDGRERILNESDLLICDQKRPVAIAGVMGGQNSEVDENTRDVLIESAHFAPRSIRRTSKHLGLQTDASKRFERHVDPNGVLCALDRAAQLMQEIACGEICTGSLDIQDVSFPPRSVNCRLTRLNAFLGTQIGMNEVENILKRLDFSVYWDGKNTFELVIPTYRADIKEEVDLIEEVARIYGYDNIVCGAPQYHASTLPHAPIFLFENKARERLLAEGLQEFLTCDLIGPSLINIAKESSMPEAATVRVLNPTSVEQSVLRTSLLPGLLQVVKYNASHQNTDIAGFEIGRIHFKEKEDYKEQSMVGILLTGKSRPHHWKQKPEEFDFFDLKGVVENFLDLMGVKGPLFKNNSFSSLHPGRQASIYVGPLEIGSFGEVHPLIVQRLDVPQRIFFAEINLHDLYKVQAKTEKVHDLTVFPSSSRDWTVSLQSGIAIDVLLKQLREIASPLLEEVKLVDIYENDALGKGIRNATFHFVYRDKEKTIAQEAVDAEHGRLVDTIMKIVK